MKIFLTILVLVAMGEAKRGRGKGPAPPPALDNFEANAEKSSKGDMFLTLDFSIVNVETCAALCNEMERCSGFTFRSEAEKNSKAGQCRFKDNIKVTTDDPNRTTYVKKEEEPESPPAAEGEPM